MGEAFGPSFQSSTIIVVVFVGILVCRGDGVVDLVLEWVGGLLLSFLYEEPISLCLTSSTSVGGLGSSFIVIRGGEMRRPPSLPLPLPPPLLKYEFSFSFLPSLSFSSCFSIA